MFGRQKIFMPPISLRIVFICAAFYLLLLLQSCKPDPQNKLIAEWYQTSETFVPWVTNTENMVLRLYTKGVYTQYGSYSYSFGRWRYNEKGAYMHLHQETGTSKEADQYLKIESLQYKQLTAGLFLQMPFYSNRQQELYHFKRQENDSKADPYSPEANEWRIQPAAPESSAAIKKRVVGYLHFLQAMYQHAIDNDMETLSDSWYATPIQMHYANGVRMAYSTELDNWNSCFYDSAQAVKGYQFISGGVYDLKLKKGVNRFERNLDCVEQLLKGLEK